MIRPPLFEKMKETISMNDAYPGYPTERLTLTQQELDEMDVVEIPEGPWLLNNDNLPEQSQIEAFRAAGYEIDSKGRPLHPGLRQMITNPEMGVVAGRGFYWNWGPNFTADPIVMTKTAQPRVLLIKRGDTGSWALPGGFVDPEDTSAAEAALRELKEEAGLHIEPQELTEVYVGVVGDRRTTAHAWAETSAYLLQLERQVPIQADDDAVDAKWVRLDKLDDTLFGSHSFLIEQATQLATFEDKKSIIDTLSTPRDSLEVEIIDAGHMAYDHYFVRDDSSHLFVKEHDASRFSDPFREAHSRAYLQKEAAIYDHIAERGFSHIPDRIELVEDALLAMDALHEKDGWHWRAPRNDQLPRYIEDVLRALKELSLVPIPKDPDYHQAIDATYETFWKEGWDDIDTDTLTALEQKILALSQNWTDKQKAGADTLINALPTLSDAAAEVSKPKSFVMGHNDARQSNIAWHPEQGARVVDWSWGDPAPEGADATMFLVDLHKSGHDVSNYLNEINKDQLVTLIGFWLAHSLWQTRDGSTTIREHQVASAIAAHQLLTLISETEEK